MSGRCKEVGLEFRATYLQMRGEYPGSYDEMGDRVRHLPYAFNTDELVLIPRRRCLEDVHVCYHRQLDTPDGETITLADENGWIYRCSTQTACPCGGFLTEMDGTQGVRLLLVWWCGASSPLPCYHPLPSTYIIGCIMSYKLLA